MEYFFLQETHSSQDCELIWADEWSGKAIFCHGSTNSKGVAMMFSKNLDIKIIEIKKDR